MNVAFSGGLPTSTVGVTLRLKNYNTKDVFWRIRNCIHVNEVSTAFRKWVDRAFFSIVEYRLSHTLVLTVSWMRRYICEFLGVAVVTNVFESTAPPAWRFEYILSAQTFIARLHTFCACTRLPFSAIVLVYLGYITHKVLVSGCTRFCSCGTYGYIIIVDSCAMKVLSHDATKLFNLEETKNDGNNSYACYRLCFRYNFHERAKVPWLVTWPRIFIQMKLLVRTLQKDARLEGIPLEEEHGDFLLDLALNKQRQSHLQPAKSDHSKELVALAYGILIII